MMRIKIVAQTCLTVICLSVIAVGLTHGAESEKEPPIRLQWLTIPPGFDATRLEAVGKAVDFQRWPQTDARRVGPKVDKSLLLHPELVTREFASHTLLPFGLSRWVRGKWSCRRLVETKQPLPTELPPDRKKNLLESLSPELQKDSDSVEKYLKRKLESYRRSKGHRLDGEMYLRVCVAPNSRAAQEYLLATMTESSMTTEGVVSMYAGAKRPVGLGTLSFLRTSHHPEDGEDVRILFVRDNLCLDIRARGCFASEALPLARKIDANIAKQPALTFQQLLGRRPAVTISPNLDTAMTEGQRTVSYEISVPPAQKILLLRALGNGRLLKAKDGKIYLPRRTGEAREVRVELTVITSELLANTVERDLMVHK